MARNSVKIGIFMLVLWIIPLLGFILAVTGLAIAIGAYLNVKDTMAKAAIFLNSLGLGLSLLNMAVSLYLFLSGDLDISFLLESLNGRD